VAAGLIDIRAMRRVWRTSRTDALTMAVTFVATLTIRLEVAILVGVLVSLLIYLNWARHPQVVRVVPDPRAQRRFRAPEPESPLCPQLDMLRIDGALFFGSVEHIRDEIEAAREARPATPLTNYVFMGSGEPTHNLKAVVQALRVMTDPEGLGIGARRITVSTVGHPEAVRKLAEVDLPFNLALSVHVPTDAERVALMPGLGVSDLAATLEASRAHFDATGRRLTIEIVLLAGINDRDEDARAFARLLRGLPAAVNLIPWNAVDGIALRAPAPDRVNALAALFNRLGVTATVRRPRGQDVGVACGQLRRRALRAGPR